MPNPPRQPDLPPAKTGDPGPFLGWIDGGARGNPGPAGIGVVLDPSGGGRMEYFAYLGQCTNNVAEYAALLVLLSLSRDHAASELVVHSDSQLLVRQMLGTYKVKNPTLKTFHAEAKRLAAPISKLTFRHIPREENKDADRLANLAMDEKTSSAPLPPVVTHLLRPQVQGALSFGEKG